MKKSLHKGNQNTRNLINEINSGAITKVDVADMLGISRPTLDKRMETDMWKKTELACIRMMYA